MPGLDLRRSQIAAVGVAADEVTIVIIRVLPRRRTRSVGHGQRVTRVDFRIGATPTLNMAVGHRPANRKRR